MKKFTFLFIFALFASLFVGNIASAQSLTASQTSIVQPIGANTTSVTLTRSTGNWPGSGNYSWSISSNTGVSSSPTLAIYPATTSINNGTTDITFTFSSSATVGTYTFYLSRGGTTRTATVTVTAPPSPTATLSPSVSVFAVAGVGINMSAVAANFAGSGNYTFDWTAVGGTISGTDPISQASATSTKTITFASAGSYIVNVSISRSGATTLVTNSVTVTVSAVPTSPNMWATSSDGTQISSFTVMHGSYFAGPVNIFAPTFPGGTTGGSSTAALARSQTPTQATGAFYYLPNTSGNNGVVDIYGASATGGTPTLVGSLDLNGASNTSLGFVRIGMGPDGRGWILAEGGGTLFLARFIPSGANGLGPATVAVEDNSVSLTGTGASVANFQNGDICLDGQGGIFALANNGSGVTQIYVGAPNGTSTTLALQWTLVDGSGNGFTGSVNGVAFDQFGSLYLSTATGLYYIDQATVDGPAGTVQCRLVQAQTGLQDLASNFFPQNTTLPVTLLSFTGSLRNNVTTISWEVENEVNFSHYELERSANGANGFSQIASKTAQGSASRITYQQADNLSAISSNVVYYRLKMVDIDGKFKYSNVIMVRKDEKAITGITINPNPAVASELATVRFNATGTATVAIRVIDMTGKVVLQQQNKVYEGVNSVPVNNLGKLLPGNYVIQMINGVEVNAVKFAVAR